MKEYLQIVRSRLLREMDTHCELQDEEILHCINEIITEISKTTYIPLQERINLREGVFNSIRKLDVLQELIEDNQITEIMVNGYEEIYVERGAGIEKWNKKFSSKEKLEDVIQQIVAQCNRVVNNSSPIVDARLDNGARVNVVVEPVALNGPIMTIRRFPDEPISMEKLIKLKSITEEVCKFLEELVVAGYSILISGGTSSGKTTFLNALTGFIPKEERIITIEDNAELQVQGVSNLVRLEAKSANQGQGPKVTLRELIKCALRMRPNRIIVGEVRGEEALELLAAFNTGHEGSISTAHANSCYDMLSRLETMVLMAIDLPLEAIRRQIASGVDIMVQMGRSRGKGRRVMEIVEIREYKDGEILLNPLYEYKQGDGLVKVNSLIHREKLIRAGVKDEG